MLESNEKLRAAVNELAAAKKEVAELKARGRQGAEEAKRSQGAVQQENVALAQDLQAKKAAMAAQARARRRSTFAHPGCALQGAVLCELGAA